MTKETLTNLIKKALADLGFDTSAVNFTVEHPDDLSHGDYATNVALILSKIAKKNPAEFAKNLAEKINQINQAGSENLISKVEVAGPGFINFYLAPEFFANQTKEISKRGKKFGQNKIQNGQKFFIEHTQPNPFKEFHIGHLMNNAIGESVTRIIKAQGAKVRTATYHGDVGLHVAKTIWAILKKGQTLENVGAAYAMGSQFYETDEVAKKEIVDINKKIYEKSDREINKIYKQGRKESFAHFESLYSRLGSDFNYHFYESDAAKVGQKIVTQKIEEGVFEKSEGAVVFRGEKFGLHTRVFINSEGIPTYETKEIGLAKIKSKKFNYNHSVTVTANEQDSFFDVVEVAIGEVYPNLKGQLKHLSHGILKLPSGKMSSRTGQVISAESLIDKVDAAVLEKMAERDLSEDDKKEISEIISLGAIKYSILKQAIGSDIVFDFDKSISFEGDSGPYLQYSCVRAMSILQKAKEEKIRADARASADAGASVANRNNSEIYNLEKLLYRFPEIVERAGREYAPHYLALYLTELASEFSSFYAQGKIVDKNDSNSPYKIAVTEAFLTVMKNGLDLLGIQVPKRM